MTSPQPGAGGNRTFLARVGGLIGHHPVAWVVTWVVIAAAAFAVALGGVTGERLFDRLHQGEPTVKGESLTARNIVEDNQRSANPLMLQVQGASLGDPGALRAGAAATAALTRADGVATVQSALLSPKGPSDPSVAPLVGKGGVSSGRFITVVGFDKNLSGDALTKAEAAVRAGFDKVVAAFPHATGTVGGIRPVVAEIRTTVEHDLLRGEGIALPLTFVVMFFVFGGFVAAGMPVAGAVVAIAGSLLSLFGFSHLTDLDVTVVNIVTLLGFGLSIDYGLLLVSRFREELWHSTGGEVADRDQVVFAAERTVATAGRTVLFSGVTVAIALSGLITFEAQLMRAIGLAGVSVVILAMLVSVTLVPALAVLGARHLGRRSTEPVADEGAFGRLARAVQRRPVTVIVVVTAVLLWLALPMLSLRLTASGTELLPKTAPARVFFDRLATDYPALSNPDVTVVARSTDTAAVTEWAQTLRNEPGVTGVAVKPLGTEYQRVDVSVAGPPTSDDAQALVTHVHSNRPAFTTWVTGQAAGQMDFLESMLRGAPWAVGLVVLGTFVLLFLMTGSVIVPLKALLLNIISLGASLGVVAWIFQAGNLEGPLNFSSVGAVESMVPFLVLAFGFGLSMDYEVFLLSRITEFHLSGLDNDRAVALGLQRSGRIITSAALLIVIVFAGFIAGDMLIIKQMGVALVVAVVIDASLVRMLLVPATMTLLGRWNWWAPVPLRRVHARFGVRE